MSPKQVPHYVIVFLLLNLRSSGCGLERTVNGTALKLYFTSSCMICSSPAELSTLQWTDVRAYYNLNCSYQMQLMSETDLNNTEVETLLAKASDLDEETCFSLDDIR